MGRRAVAAILEDNHGVLASGQHRSLRSSIWRLAREGFLAAVFPGIYVRRSQADNPRVWLAALSAWRPDAVITGRVALAVADGRLPATVRELGEVVLHHPGRVRNLGRVRFRQRPIDRTSIAWRSGIRIHVPAAAAVDKAGSDDGKAIDDLLRESHADPSVLEPHLAPHRRTPGNALRRAVVKASLTKPFSFAERALHRTLTAARITGWVANAALKLGRDVVRPDLLFPGLGLVIEFDGRAFHGTDRFESDRRRHNLLVRHGYTVLRFTWDMLSDPGYVVDTIAATMRALSRTAG